MLNFLKKMKIYFCCGSKCVINDTENIHIDQYKPKEQRDKYYKDDS